MPEFTPEQLAATDYLRKDACIVAGPGSGKTTVLVERYRRLVFEHSFEPRQILAITFTEKAAANMKAKLAEQFRHDPIRRRDLESAPVSTIHGFCVRLLKENAIAAGVDPRFSVLSPRESDILQWECLNRALDDLTTLRREETLEMIEALNTPQIIGDLRDAYDAMRSAGMAVAQVAAKLANTPGTKNLTADLRQILNSWTGKLTDTRRFEHARLRSWCDEFDAAQNLNFADHLALLGKLNINLGRVPPESKDVLREFRDVQIAAATSAAVDRHVARFRAMIFDVIARFDEDYRNRKNTQGRVDFNDLERHAIALLKNSPEVRRRVHAQFRQIMLDEFQDINGQQAELIFLLRAPGVFFGVGDSNQSIYGFRHARPEIFRRYEEEVTFQAGQSVKLFANFRSREAILNCVREVLANCEGIKDRELVSGKIFAGKDEPSIEVLKVIDSSESDREALWISHRIQELCGTLQLGKPGETRAAEYRDFAVLCRNSDSTIPILAAFDHAGIPYVSGRRQSFLLSREGLDITALLSVIANPRDSISLATVLRGPLVSVTDGALLNLRNLASGLTEGLNKFAHTPTGVPEPDATKLKQFTANLTRWRQDEPIIPLDILLARALTDCGQSWRPNSREGANIESFLQLARNTGPGMDLPAFLQEIDSLTNAAGTESELADEDQGNCVQVMTAHAAKGLEFKVTIIAGMEKGPRRESRPITFTEQHGLGIKWRNPHAKEGKDPYKDSWSEANKLALKAREAEEENRLLYVAMTRAEEHLILSYSVTKGKPQNWAGLIENRFNISQLMPSPQALHEQRVGFSVSIRVADFDPPPLARSPGPAPQSEVEIIAKPVIEDQHETTVAVTSLAVFGACPRKYYIQRSLGWNTGRFRRFEPDENSADDGEDSPDDEADLPASRIGSAVHEILAGQTPTDDSPEARELADIFLNSDVGRRAAASPKSAREWAFIVEIDGTILRGTIDLWFEDNGSIHLVDYKTDEVSAVDAAARAREYAPQLALYAIALERALGLRPKVASLHFLRPNTVVEVPLDDEAIDSARALIAGLRKSQNELSFPLNEGGHCRSCQFYRSLCPAGRNNPPDAIVPSGILEEA